MRVFSGQALRDKIRDTPDDKFLLYATPTEKGFSLSQKIVFIAEALKITPDTIWKYIYEKTKTQPKLRAICEFLECELIELAIPAARQTYEAHILDFHKIRDTRENVIDNNVELIRHAREILKWERLFQIVHEKDTEEIDEHSRKVADELHNLILGEGNEMGNTDILE